jgi:hypothetical protein
MALARDELALQQPRAQRADDAHADARVAEREALPEAAVQHVLERARVGDHRDRSRLGFALQQPPRVRLLLGGLGQALLELEAPLAEERRVGATTVGRRGGRD